MTEYVIFDCKFTAMTINKDSPNGSPDGAVEKIENYVKNMDNEDKSKFTGISNL